MRVIHVTNSQGDSIFGIERHILYLATAQKARGMNVSVVVDLANEGGREALAFNIRRSRFAVPVQRSAFGVQSSERPKPGLNR